MKVALVNPAWRFEGGVYFGCREAHLPLELGYAAAALAERGHEPQLFDASLDDLDSEDLADAVAAFAPDMTVLTTAPTYLFWRCPPPELRSPIAFARALVGRGGRLVVVGPHGSTTPAPVLRKLDADIVVRGECEEIVAALADADRLQDVPSIAFRRGGEAIVNGPPAAARFVDAPPLAWPARWIRRKRHHHHRFDVRPDAPGAEVEASRGCPYACTFCAKLDFRDRYRRRRLDLLLAEIDALIAQGARYLYFIDEIFLPDRALLHALRERRIAFGVQTRIDLWKPAMLDLLGEAGCVSIEAGVESLTVAGRAALDKSCRLDTDALADRLIYAKTRVPFVQANLIRSDGDDDALIDAWRARLRDAGVWANDPVPLFPYPASPEYRARFGEPDDLAWERALDAYLQSFPRFSDIQERTPKPLSELEA